MCQYQNKLVKGSTEPDPQEKLKAFNRSYQEALSDLETTSILNQQKEAEVFTKNLERLCGESCLLLFSAATIFQKLSMTVQWVNKDLVPQTRIPQKKIGMIVPYSVLIQKYLSGNRTLHSSKERKWTAQTDTNIQNKTLSQKAITYNTQER